MSAYQQIVERIYKLSAEQHKLYLGAAKKELSAAQRKRLAQIKVELQNLWLARRGLRPHCTDNLEVLMQARWHPASMRS
jgi:hypothetical protein